MVGQLGTAGGCVSCWFVTQPKLKCHAVPCRAVLCCAANYSTHQCHADEGLQLRPVDVRSTGTTVYEDPLHVDEAIVFYRVGLDPALRELVAEGQPEGEQQQ